MLGGFVSRPLLAESYLFGGRRACGGTSKPSILAVRTLMTNSNLAVLDDGHRLLTSAYASRMLAFTLILGHLRS
jgi:hypothetical protein